MVVMNENSMTSSENYKQTEVPTIKRQSQQQQQQQTSTQQNANINNNESNPEVLLAMLLQAVGKLWGQIKQASTYLMDDLGGYQLFDCLRQWCVQHPQMAICLLAAGLVGFLPIFIFVAFVLSTILMAFTGFLVLEGTLLTILTMMMFGLLGVLIVMLLFLGIIGLATYFGVAHAYDIFGSTTESVRTSLRKARQTTNQSSSQFSSGDAIHIVNREDENIVY